MEPESASRSHRSAFASIGALLSDLAAADDERAVLDTVLACLGPWPPDTAELVFVDADSDGRPGNPRVVAAWREGHVLTDSDGQTPAELPATLWTTPPTPELTATATSACAVLPLHSGKHGGWLGALRLAWASAHAFTAEERDAQALVMTALATHLGGLRTQQALRASLAERELLHDVIRQLNLTTNLEERLRVLLQPAPAADEAEVALCTIESDAAGVPTWLTMVSVLPALGKPPSSEPGARYHLPSIPFAGLYLSSPDAPLLIDDVTQDPRVDDYARSLYAMTGVRATIILALTLHGRWVGLLNIIWQRPVALGEREQRIYRALAAQAALLVDHSLMVERLQTTLQAAQHQGELLQAVLDHIPVGVVLVDAPTNQPILTNAAAHALLGEQPYQVTDDPSARTYTIALPGADKPIPASELVGVRVATSGVMETEEVDIVAANRERTQLEVTAVPMFAENAVKNVLLVLADVTARKRAEGERLRLQDEVIHIQAAALAERSAPIIPITDDILVLPIVGSIDVDRGQQVLTAILEGTAQRRAKVAIIDITGVGAVDTHAATALTGAARALRLLGVQPILSGIRPDVAQILVNLGVNLDGIATCGTLQSSIQYALGRLGRTGLAK